MTKLDDLNQKIEATGAISDLLKKLIDLLKKSDPLAPYCRSCHAPAELDTASHLTKCCSVSPTSRAVALADARRALARNNQSWRVLSAQKANLEYELSKPKEPRRARQIAGIKAPNTPGPTTIRFLDTGKEVTLPDAKKARKWLRTHKLSVNNCVKTGPLWTFDDQPKGLFNDHKTSAG